MNKTKYIVIFVLIYIIYRMIYGIFNKNESETYVQITNNLKILYENLTGNSSSNSSIPVFKSPSLSKLITSYTANLNSPSRTINLAVTLPSGVVTTLPCIGNCINCVVSRLTPSGCFVTEKK